MPTGRHHRGAQWVYLRSLSKCVGYTGDMCRRDWGRGRCAKVEAPPEGNCLSVQVSDKEGLDYVVAMKRHEIVLEAEFKNSKNRMDIEKMGEKIIQDDCKIYEIRS